MLQLRHYSFNLPFEYPFTLSKGTKTHQPTLITGLGLGQLWGFGEATAIAYYNVSVEGMAAMLEEKRGMIEKYALTDPQRFWHFLHHLIPEQHFLISALDIAGWDLFAQMRRQPVYKLLGIEWGPTPVTDYTIGIGSAEQMLEKMQQNPWPIYKIKCGTPEDLDTLRLLRANNADAAFRVDANEKWTFDEAKRLLPELKALGVDMIEQPLPKTAIEEMKELKAISPIPLYADESCCTEDDVKKCAEQFHGINIKLAKCGGITPAMRMVKEARALGLKIMMGSMSECSVGTAAVANMLPLLDEVDADGPLLLAEDLAEGLTYENGTVKLSGRPGLGIRFTGPKPANHIRKNN